MHLYSSADNRLRAYATIVTPAVVVAILLNALSDRYNFAPPWLVSAPTVAAAYATLFELVDRRAWRWRWVRLLADIDTPNIAGTYEGELWSNYSGGKQLPTSIEIEQTWTRLIVHFKVLGVETSTSVSVTGALSSRGSHKASLDYGYRNTVRQGVADPDMGSHDGTAQVTIDTESGTLDGTYYNFRGRNGRLTMQRL